MMTNTTQTLKAIRSFEAHAAHPDCPADIKRDLNIRAAQLRRRLAEQLKNDAVRARLNREQADRDDYNPFYDEGGEENLINARARGTR